MNLDLAEKDAVLFALPEDLASAFGKELGLGGVLNVNSRSEIQLQLLCIRESGSSEFYADSRVPPITISATDIVKVYTIFTFQASSLTLFFSVLRSSSDDLQVLDTYPSQRPIPSLGGGIGYGAEAVDCWELQVSFPPLPSPISQFSQDLSLSLRMAISNIRKDRRGIYSVHSAVNAVVRHHLGNLGTGKNLSVNVAV